MQLITEADLEYLARIVLAAFCGGIIGFERQRRFKSAGIRTHVIVAISAALMMVVSKYGFFDVAGTRGISLDASRIAAGVVTAIGFLGVGVIYVRGETIRGITTAAGLWATVGVGITLGAGMYFVGIAAAAVILLAQILLHRRSFLTQTQQSVFVVMKLRTGRESEEDSLRRLEEKLGAIESMDVKRKENGILTLRCEIALPENDCRPAEILKKLEEIPNIYSIYMRPPQ